MDDPRDQRIAQLEAELAHQRAQMQSLVATVSHDLRAPLRHITSYVQLVQEDAGPQLNAEVQGFLVTITDSARQLGAMLDALLELSRVGSAPVVLQVLDLSLAVQVAVQEVGLRRGAAAVQWNIAESLPLVAADAALLHKVLCAVLDNALKFSTPGSIPVIDITVCSALPSEERVVLSIRDQGVGCAQGPASRLFQPFQRLHTAREFPGIGIGLAVARRAVERMQGAIELLSEKGAGCEIRITLPTGTPRVPGAADCGSLPV